MNHRLLTYYGQEVNQYYLLVFFLSINKPAMPERSAANIAAAAGAVSPVKGTSPAFVSAVAAVVVFFVVLLLSGFFFLSSL